jgi:hypothetical protein
MTEHNLFETAILANTKDRVAGAFLSAADANTYP